MNIGDKVWTKTEHGYTAGIIETISYDRKQYTIRLANPYGRIAVRQIDELYETLSLAEIGAEDSVNN